jgi:hypothetical protein
MEDINEIYTADADQIPGAEIFNAEASLTALKAPGLTFPSRQPVLELVGVGTAGAVFGTAPAQFQHWADFSDRNIHLKPSSGVFYDVMGGLHCG